MSGEMQNQNSAKDAKSHSDLIFNGVLVLCLAVVEFAVMRYIEDVPE